MRRHRDLGLVSVDVVVSLVAFLVSWLIVSSAEPDPHIQSKAPDPLAYALLVLACAPIALRRRWCRLALALALVAGVVYAAGQYPPVLAPAVPVVVYTAATELDRRQSRLALVVSVLVTWLATAVAAGPTDLAAPLVVAGCWLLGHYVRTRRLLVGELQDKAASLEREREERARRAVAEERLRIARELHDVLTHTISVIAVQAGTGRLVGAARPEQAVGALARVEETSRSALQELRQLLGVLRADDVDDPALAPVPGLGDLDALVARVTQAGVAVDVHIEGQPRAVTAALDRSAYRIVQEALTNVVKHAGPARALVLVRYDHDRMTLEVSDDGRGWPAATMPASGHGISGMRERVALHGGELIAGPQPEGGFLVQARLPLTPTGS